MRISCKIIIAHKDFMSRYILVPFERFKKINRGVLKQSMRSLKGNHYLDGASTYITKSMTYEPSMVNKIAFSDDIPTFAKAILKGVIS